MSDTRFPIYEPNRNESLNRGLVGWWLASGKTGWGTRTLRDISGYGNHGSIVNVDATENWSSNGISSHTPSVNLDGNDYIDIANRILWYNPTQYTVCGWIYPRTLPASADCGVISQWGDGGAGNASWRLAYDTAGTVAVYNYNGSSSGSVSGGAIAANRWSWISAAWNGGNNTALVMVNGGTTSGSLTIAPQSSTYPVYIGRDVVIGSGKYHNGLVADVRIFNLALTAAEIQALYLDSLRGYRRTLRFRKVPFAVGTAAPATNPKGVFGLALDGPTRRVVC